MSNELRILSLQEELEELKKRREACEKNFKPPYYSDEVIEVAMNNCSDEEIDREKEKAKQKVKEAIDRHNQVLWSIDRDINYVQGEIKQLKSGESFQFWWAVIYISFILLGVIICIFS